MNNINYEHLYRKYKNKYINLKNNNLQKGGDPITPQIKLEQGMCVKGHPNPLYKDHLTRIFEVCGNKDKCTLVGNNNYITLMDGMTISIEGFNKFYTVKKECPGKNTDWDTTSNPGHISLHVDNKGFFFNVGDKVIHKYEKIAHHIPTTNEYRIYEIYRSDNDEILITIININKPDETPITLSSDKLKSNYFIAHPDYTQGSNYAYFGLRDIEGMQNSLILSNKK
jgi:hypothetical protein